SLRSRPAALQLRAAGSGDPASTHAPRESRGRLGLWSGRGVTPTAPQEPDSPISPRKQCVRAGTALAAAVQALNRTHSPRRVRMLKSLVCSVGVALMLGGLTAVASAPDGAIFTTLPDGSRVNYNIYGSKPDVYLDGGPGDQAPITAAGLPDGTYVFQVTDPSGKGLLSIDQAKCRQFTVAGGIITSVVATGCEHAIGVDVDHGAQGAVTVQLCGGGAANPLAPTACFNDTPNPGGEYKVWVTMVQDYLDGCALLGKPNGLDE